jgi:hypothetical protein
MNVGQRHPRPVQAVSGMRLPIAQDAILPTSEKGQYLNEPSS